MKLFVYETPVDTHDELTSQIVIASVDIASAPSKFERVWQFFGRMCQLCANNIAADIQTFSVRMPHRLLSDFKLYCIVIMLYVE